MYCIYVYFQLVKFQSDESKEKKNPFSPVVPGLKPIEGITTLYKGVAC